MSRVGSGSRIFDVYTVRGTEVTASNTRRVLWEAVERGMLDPRVPPAGDVVRFHGPFLAADAAEAVALAKEEKTK